MSQVTIRDIAEERDWADIDGAKQTLITKIAASKLLRGILQRLIGKQQLTSDAGLAASLAPRERCVPPVASLVTHARARNILLVNGFNLVEQLHFIGGYL